MKGIDEWMTINKLKLNKSRTESNLLVCYQYRPKTPLDVLSLGPDKVYSSRSIGPILNDKFNFEKQIAASRKSSFIHVQNIYIARIRIF